ncbi:MAG: hypothetical protein MRY21_06300 [Simkaniaceae bacterium]|nr:hypothetical protein [Simkaniaceae bacterium]
MISAVLGKTPTLILHSTRQMSVARITSPLLLEGETLLSRESLRDKSLYMGTGFCTSKSVSIGLPLDVLSMILIAEKCRGATGASGVTHLLADTHAMQVHPESVHDEIQEMTEKQAKCFTNLYSNLGLNRVTLLRASEIASTPSYTSELQALEKQVGTYMSRQMADMRILHRERDVVSKVSWAVPSKKPKLDERTFDREYCRLFGEDSFSFVYTKSGRNFDSKRKNVAPYTTVEGESRVTLIPPSTDALASSGKSARASQQYFADIASEFETLIGPLPAGDTREKIDALLDLILRS